MLGRVFVVLCVSVDTKENIFLPLGVGCRSKSPHFQRGCFGCFSDVCVFMTEIQLPCTDTVPLVSGCEVLTNYTPIMSTQGFACISRSME